MCSYCALCLLISNASCLEIALVNIVVFTPVFRFVNNVNTVSSIVTTQVRIISRKDAMHAKF